MNIIETAKANRAALIDALKDADARALEFPTMEYSVYIDSDGEIGYEEWMANDNAFYQFRDGYSRTYIHTFCHQYFDSLWDYWLCDSSSFDSEFFDRFGIMPEHDDSRSLREDGEFTAREHGFENDYWAWLEDEKMSAIADAVSEDDLRGQYDMILDVFIENYNNFREGW